MKKIIRTTLLLLVFSALSAIPQDTQPRSTALPVGMKTSSETLQGEILKVYAADDEGLHFRAYVVHWKDREVIVSDMLGTSDKKEGDTITFMVHRMEMPHRNGTVTKKLDFMLLEMPLPSTNTVSP